MHPWARRNIPQLAGRLALVTGANSGLGWQAARTLAGKGATVVMACRNREQAERARRAILDEYPQARLELTDLDLADLASIRACAAGFRQRHERLDLLFNNAGVMFLPLRRTRDGFEMQMGTNHLGHFALTGLLLESLLAAPRPRVVGMTSGFNQFGRLPLDDLNAERGYNRYLAYCHSKQANLLFSLELQRRAGQRGVLLQSLAAHPGYAATNLQYAAPAMSGSRLGRWAEGGQRSVRAIGGDGGVAGTFRADRTALVWRRLCWPGSLAGNPRLSGGGADSAECARPGAGRAAVGAIGRTDRSTLLVGVKAPGDRRIELSGRPAPGCCQAGPAGAPGAARPIPRPPAASR